MRGEFKTPGGKLVAVDFDVRDEHLHNVQITGDFFLYPEEALDDLLAALEGLPVQATRDEVAAAVARSLDPDVSMVGFSPEAVGIAVARGLGHDDE